VAHRIAHILPWTTVGGTEISTLRIARGLTGPDYQHIAFCSEEATSVESFFRAAGFPTATYRSVELSFRRPGPFLKASLHLARELRLQRIDLVHCSDLMGGLRAAPGARLARIPVVCHVRNPHPDLPRRDRPPLYAVNRFIFVSHHTWDTFACRVPLRRGSVVYDGIATTSFDRDVARQRLRAEFSIPPTTQLVGMVGRLASQKDYPTLIKAAVRVLQIHPGVRFLVVGDHRTTEAFREYYRTLEDLLDAQRIRQHFIFTGFREDIPQILSALDVFVLASHFEGFPLVILEAMAQQTPVIATAVGGVPEVVQDGCTGLLHRHEDDADLASKILALLSDEVLRQRLGHAAHQLVQDQFTLPRFVAGIAGTYRSTLSGIPPG
jgi:glycosyltransferase involved in cell wall biosynthesis